MTSRNLAYVIYTSGSTVSKGVMVEHNNVVNYFHSIQGYAHMSSLSRVDCSSSMVLFIGEYKYCATYCWFSNSMCYKIKRVRTLYTYYRNKN